VEKRKNLSSGIKLGKSRPSLDDYNRTNDDDSKANGDGQDVVS
jgi:hypothetical protein